MHNKDAKLFLLDKSSKHQKKSQPVFTNTAIELVKIQKEMRSVTYEKTVMNLLPLLKENEEPDRKQTKIHA